jgi:hypothetical protein
MNALGLVQQATAEMGLLAPSYLIGNTAQDQIQQLAMLNALGLDLVKEYDWQALTSEYRFTTVYYALTGTTTINSPVVTGISSTANLDTTFIVNGTGVNTDCYIQTVDSSTQVTLNQNASATGTVTLTFMKVKYPVPSDYDRKTDRTDWDKSKRWSMIGPSSAQEWQFIKSGYISTGPRLRYRIMGGYYQMYPGLASNQELIGYEYISNAWVRDTSANAKTSFTIDTDTCIFPDRLMVLGLKLKYFEIKGFDTTALYRDYSAMRDMCKAQDGQAGMLSMSPQMTPLLLSSSNLPDTGFGQ